MVLLETKSLTKYFGDTHAVDRVDFSVAQGELLALIGSNGAGKTTLVNLISGLLRPDSGTILFQGADVTAMSVYDRIRAGIARSFQLVTVFDQLGTLDNVGLAIFSREGKTLATALPSEFRPRGEGGSLRGASGVRPRRQGRVNPPAGSLRGAQASRYSRGLCTPAKAAVSR